MTLRRAGILVMAVVLLTPAPAYAAGHYVTAVPMAGILGSVFGGIGHALLGAFSWTIGLASKFILTTIAALVKMLIPHSWVHQGLQIMRWIVAVPNYAGKITSPSGATAYGFAGINGLRDVFMWLGIAIAPLTLVYATSRAMIGEGDPIGVPVLRMLAVSVVIASYPYWWSQAAALVDQVTNAILSIPAVTQGLYKLMDYAVDGVALGGWQLVDLALMGAVGLELLGLIFLKVVLILLGALLYATGPLTIGLVPTRAGSALARAWVSSVMMLFGIGIAWATVFAVGALLIGDASSAGPLIAGNTAFGSLAGGLLLAVAGLASIWVCIKLAKEAGALLRIQLSGLLVLAGSHSSSPAQGSAARNRTTGSSLREYGSRLGRAAGAANGELALAGAGGAALAGTARAAAYVGRRGLLGAAAGGAQAGAARVSAPGSAALGHTRAGAVASRMARAGTASWIAAGTHADTPTSRAHTSDAAENTNRGEGGGRRRPQSAAHQSERTSSPAAKQDRPDAAERGRQEAGRRGGPIGATGTPPPQGNPRSTESRPFADGSARGTSEPERRTASTNGHPGDASSGGSSRHPASPPSPNASGPPAPPTGSTTHPRPPAAASDKPKPPVDQPTRSPQRRRPKRGGR